MKLLILPRRQRKIWQDGLRRRELDRRLHRGEYPWHCQDYRATVRVQWYSYLITVQAMLSESLAEYYPRHCTVRRINGKALQQRKISARLMREQRLDHEKTWPKIK